MPEDRIRVAPNTVAYADRASHNVIHHSTDTNINPTFEMVSTLFLAALPNLKTLHRLTVAAGQ